MSLKLLNKQGRKNKRSEWDPVPTDRNWAYSHVKRVNISSQSFALCREHSTWGFSISNFYAVICMGLCLISFDKKLFSLSVIGNVPSNTFCRSNNVPLLITVVKNPPNPAHPLLIGLSMFAPTSQPQRVNESPFYLMVAFCTRGNENLRQ